QRNRQCSRDSREPELERHEPSQATEHLVRIDLDVPVRVNRVEGRAERGAKRKGGGEAARAQRLPCRALRSRSRATPRETRGQPSTAITMPITGRDLDLAASTGLRDRL